ncbi:TPA: hypothetical protein OUE28_000736 [Morganella morganii]|uniref:hypothetical protein n=1 Tax=Morganella morganii TaxID=582 RepID=UPI000BBD3616|nr:hypothetical protein [Morganella morganii]ATF54094.1 hypothetical protein CO693_10470 [Morganella morganii]EGT3608926.1 hypothetical protein [Morganella morganii]MBC4002426.1 hypothetical protein [Morganella morganii]MBT0333443.1 hypothetical protein [Morganella morganii subsp. morganii]MBT0355046.1 hypothetical protein [Morganella morganii subsp. morganii]
MKELSVRECDAIIGSGIADFLRPGSGDVSPSVTPEKTGGQLIIGGGIGLGFGGFPFIVGVFISGIIKIPR